MLKKPMMALAFAGALAAAGTVSAASVDSSSYAQEINVSSAFKQTEQPQQITMLSAQEMQDTQGAWIWVPLYYAPAITAVAVGAFHSSAYMPLYHLGNGISSVIRR